MYTLTDTCSECGSDDINVIDREFDRTSQCFRYRHYCICCGHDWWEEEEEESDIEEDAYESV